MQLLNTRKYAIQTQFLASISVVLGISFIGYLFVHLIGYKVVALILLLTVSVIAMLFDIIPVLSAAFLSALIWNFFFIPPVFTFHIDNAEDLLMFLMYFVIAMVNAVLTFKIREQETKVRDKEDKEQALKLYNTLLNSLSHELRTPVSAIMGAVDTLIDNKQNLTEQNQAELLSQIDIASVRLNREVDNLLNMSRLESGMLKLHLDWCDMNELIFSVIQKLASSSGDRTIIFRNNEKLPLYKIDAGLIGQALHNIIYNALLYTQENATIKIEVSDQSPDCRISISDNGTGFPESEMGKVFEKFFRLPKTKTGGSGLGLSISKGFIEAHNGKITLENLPEGGAKFTITIPAETSFLNNMKNE